MRTRALACCVSAILTAQLSAQPWAQPCPPDRDPTLWALLDEATEAAARAYPRSTGPTLGDDRYNDQLEDLSPDAIETRRLSAIARLQRAQALDRTAFTEADHLDADLLIHDLETSIAGAEFHPEQMPVTSVNGPQYWLPQMADFVPLTESGHYDDYLRRLEGVPGLLAQHIANMRAGMEAGRVPPAIAVEPAVAQAAAQARFADTPKASPFYKPFVNHPAGDPRARRAEQIVAGAIIPAYAELAAFLEAEYLPACRASIGISDGPDGVAAYSDALRRHTTLDLTADEVHEIGLAEVARLRAEMMETIARTDAPANQQTWPDDDAKFAAFIEYLRTDPRFTYDDPDTLMRAYRDICKTIDPELPRLFGRLPRLPYGVREIPPFAAPSSPSAYYYNGSLEGGVPGYFMVNTYRLDQRPIYEMTALAIHEAVPGHHLQIALAQEMEDVHAYRKLTGYTAFVEGWALYSESLGLEMEATSSPPLNSSPALAGTVSLESSTMTEGAPGPTSGQTKTAEKDPSPQSSPDQNGERKPDLPSSPRPRGEDRGEGSGSALSGSDSETQVLPSATSASPSRPLRSSDLAVDQGLYTDPYQDFGRLNFEMWRAMRLVVDTGIHAQGWTRQQAIDYMTANSAISEHNIRAEVDRYIGWPGQATGYKIGQMRILAMRRQAEAALGADFDIRAFHDHLLGAGALPLPVLEARMQRWIESQ